MRQEMPYLKEIKTEVLDKKTIEDIKFLRYATICVFSVPMTRIIGYCRTYGEVSFQQMWKGLRMGPRSTRKYVSMLRKVGVISRRPTSERAFYYVNEEAYAAIIQSFKNASYEIKAIVNEQNTDSD